MKVDFGNGAAAMKLLGTLILLPSILSVGCTHDGAGGEAQAQIVMALSSADVTSATVTISGAGISPALVSPLTHQGDQWVGIVQKIPAGVDRTFVVEAFDASGAAIYRGQATGVTITKGSTVVVAITAQQIDAPPTSHNAAPIIDAVVVSAVAIAPSETIAIGVQAHDPNAGESLSYAWSGAGTFSAASSASTSWSAPAVEGTYPLVIAVSDPNGETASMSFPVSVNVANGKGDASIAVTINTWPSISDLSAAPTRLVASGSTTSLDVAASDADGDALAYGWSADCSGSFSAASERAPTFTLSALPATGSCTFTVTVTDGRGGTNTGTLNLPTGPEPTVNQAPQITVASQSKATANPGETVNLYVQALDPEGTALTFSWSATAGTLGAPTTTANTSMVTWTAPASFSAVDIAVIVTDATGQATTQSFHVGGALVSWNEEFDGTTLGAEWSVFDYSFTGSRSHGYTSPANWSSLTANPGHLRYYVEQMTHPNGFLNGYQRSLPDQWNYTYDPGHEVYRTIEGDRWTIDAKAHYYLPSANGRGFYLRVYFGTGGANTTYVAEVVRGRDVGTPPAWVATQIYAMTGLDSTGCWPVATYLATEWDGDALDDYTMYIRIQRNGGALAVSRSVDGATWTTSTYDLGTALNGLPQRITLSGNSWFIPANSFAEYDYIRFAQF